MCASRDIDEIQIVLNRPSNTLCELRDTEPPGFINDLIERIRRLGCKGERKCGDIRSVDVRFSGIRFNNRFGVSERNVCVFWWSVYGIKESDMNVFTRCNRSWEVDTIPDETDDCFPCIRLRPSRAGYGFPGVSTSNSSSRWSA